MQNSKLRTGLFIGGFAALMLAFTFLDLPISKALFNLQNPFGNFMAAFGELPYALVGLFSCAALIATRNTQKAAANWGSLIGFGLLLLLFTFMAGFMPMNYLPLPLIFGITGPLYAILALLAANKISKSQKEALRRAATVGLLLVVLATLVINIIKIFWGRPRMRIMDDPDSQFTLWLLPQGIAASDEFKSFPSGHSANAACILWITLLPTFLPRLRTRAAFLSLNVVAYTWAALVMLSRVIMGAHFATDVTMGAGIAVLCFYLLKRRFYKTQMLG